MLGLMDCFRVGCSHRGIIFLQEPWLHLSVGKHRPLVPECLQRGRTFVLISSWLPVLLRAAAGLLCTPFTSDDIPIVLPRSPFWLTRSGPNRGFPEAKAAT